MAIILAVWWCCECVLSPALKNRTKPHKPKFTGQGWGHGGGTGLAWLLVWPFVSVMDVEGGHHQFVIPEYTRIKKKPCKHRFPGLFVVTRTDYVILSYFQMAYSPSRGIRVGGMSLSEIR
jgi:hypothetical protein